MVDDRVGRRTLLGAGVGLLASLAGCSGLFIEPETTTPTAGADSTATATPTARPAPTDRPAPTARPTATAAPLPSDRIEVRNRLLTVDRSQLEKFALVTYRFDVENVGRRTVRDVEFRVDVRYDHEELSRVVATAYPRFVFDPGGDEGSDEAREGLQPDETDRVRGETRFERDGRAENSTAVERFDLELSVRRVRYL
ncbi:hypothetical protein [Haloplanus halophilus]|uniref:hypothetical protein n=1 Tax=Haloplanus halophilus TaxID=2949993 RepID=UPI00203B1674|nr:hypothetical protein [Haloplanus sp. GDY1]